MQSIIVEDGDFSRISKNVPTSLYFAPPLRWFHLEMGTGAGGQKTRMTGLPGRRRSLTISSAVWIQCTNVTDEQADTGRQQRPRLRRASRGKLTRSSADADNRLDAFSGQSRSTNMVPFHMLHIVSYCAIVTLSLRYSFSKNFMTLKWGQRSLKVIESGIIR